MEKIRDLWWDFLWFLEDLRKPAVLARWVAPAVVVLLGYLAAIKFLGIGFVLGAAPILQEAGFPSIWAEITLATLLGWIIAALLTRSGYEGLKGSMAGALVVILGTAINLVFGWSQFGTALLPAILELSAFVGITLLAFLAFSAIRQ
jgi:hypothetical protein